MTLRKDDQLARKEHEAVRNDVGYYDFTHKLLQVKGKDAPEFVEKIYVAPLADMENGHMKYTTMLNEDGNIIDDVIVFRIDDDTYNISTLFIDELIDWMNKHLENEEVTLTDVTGDNTMFAVQGPNSRKVLDDLLDQPVDDLAYFQTMPDSVDDIDVTVARSGYTGELGYELYVNPKEAKKLEDLLVKAGEKYDMENITTDVIITSLPREKGFVLMSDLEGSNPLEAGFGWTIGWDTDFIGKDKLLEVKEEGPARKLLGITVDDDTVEVEPGTLVYKDGDEVGKVTVFTYGFTVGENIGFVLVDTEKVKIGDTVVLGEEEIPATVTERIFYDPENKRIRG